MSVQMCQQFMFVQMSLEMHENDQQDELGAGAEDDAEAEGDDAAEGDDEGDAEGVEEGDADQKNDGKQVTAPEPHQVRVFLPVDWLTR